MSPDSVNNGRRVYLPFASGAVGVVDRGEITQISYVPRGSGPRRSGTVEIEGETYTVASITQSGTTPEMVIANLKKNGKGEAQ